MDEWLLFYQYTRFKKEDDPASRLSPSGDGNTARSCRADVAQVPVVDTEIDETLQGISPKRLGARPRTSKTRRSLFEPMSQWYLQVKEAGRCVVIRSF
ncbi:hypothetical protein [Salisediminibacterium halotolerans]|uniref:hypothetical protein n=1 Tax=Salisediminibacterium halotolerans TaxID=517425 RepID=UPI000EAD05ED|nr:hypothetical protein [Salisediminibacterium halotolerans]